MYSYNIFEQSPEDVLLPACQKHHVGVIVRVPLDEGGITGQIKPDTAFEDGDFRNHYFRGDRKQEVYERVNQLAADLNDSLDQVAEVALRYVLSHPAVFTIHNRRDNTNESHRKNSLINRRKQRNRQGDRRCSR